MDTKEVRINKSPKEVSESIAKSVYGKTNAQAQQSSLCLECKQPALPRCYSEAGKREFVISGLCEIF